MENLLFNKMNGGLKVYTIACTDCIDNITNIEIIQFEKNESGKSYFSFRFKKFAFFMTCPASGQAGQKKERINHTILYLI
jgi:hypothetical protein